MHWGHEPQRIEDEDENEDDEIKHKRKRKRKRKSEIGTVPGLENVTSALQDPHYPLSLLKRFKIR